MIRNMIIVALRNIRKDIGYSAINIIGLTLGITSALFLIFYIADELSYDRYHENAGRIYRVTSTITETDDQFTWIVAQTPFGHQVREDYPEVEASVRFINMGRALFRNEDREFMEEKFYYADSSVFDVFTHKFIYGSPYSSLNEPNTIVLTRSVAGKYFGNEDPVGQSLVTGDRTFRVTGVIADVPRNSHFRFDALASRASLPEQIGSWGNFGVFTYLLLPEGTDIREFEQKLQTMYERYMAEIFERMQISIVYNLEPLTWIHLHSDHAGEPEPTGSIAYVYIFGIVALFLVFIAAMNYMNLATARSLKRAREVGMRKVLGSGKGRLVMQFLTESATLTVISLILSIIVLGLLLPEFNRLAGKNFEPVILYSPRFLVSLLFIVILVGIVGGSYPAFYLSRFSPVKVLKGEISKGTSGNLVRKMLVVTQFTISVVMIISTLIVFSQLNFLKGKDPGYRMENVIVMQLNSNEMVQRCRVFKQSLLEDRNIESVTTTNARMGEGSPKIVFNMETDEGMEERGINFAVVDHDFVSTLGVEIKSGRDFRQDMPADTLLAVIVNETLARRMNWTEPIGKRVDLGDGSLLRASVVGVMKDYHQTGLYNEIESLMLVYRYNNPFVYVRLKPDNIQDGVRHVETVWEEMFPGVPFSYQFLTDRFSEQFGSDEKRGFIFTLFTILAILISCLGLLGLVSYMVEQRKKEIGIRKVFGAGEPVIVSLICRDFLLLIAVSMIIAFPVAYYFMNNWLENFVYRIRPGISVFLFAAVITLFLTFLTVIFRAYTAAIANPARSLRVE
jgi:putative ABC transport system permease protein